MNINKRMIGIDIFRIALAFGVFLFHTNCNSGTYFGILTGFVSRLDLLMISFFMLSGFVLYKRYSYTVFEDFSSIIFFFLKRIISIMPVYLFIVISNKLLNFGSLASIATIPAELLGLQALYNSALSEISPNAGTWFVSCIIICYIFYPIIQNIIKKFNQKYLLYGFVLIFVLLVYSCLISAGLRIDSYHSPFIRIMEFTLGIIISSYSDKKDFNINKIQALFFVTIITALFIAIVSFINSINLIFYVENPICEFITVIVTMLLLIVISSIGTTRQHKIIRYFSDISYCFYMSQVFLYCNYNFAKIIIYSFDIVTNTRLFIIEFLSCLTLSIILYEIIEKPIKKLLLQRIN